MALEPREGTSGDISGRFIRGYSFVCNIECSFLWTMPKKLTLFNCLFLICLAIKATYVMQSV